MGVFSSHSFWTSSSLDVPTGVTQEEGHAGFSIHLLSAARALIFTRSAFELFDDWGGRGYDDSAPREVTKTSPARDRTT